MRRWGWRLVERYGRSETKSDRLKTIQQTQYALRKDLLATGRKLRVGFIVCDRSKWSAGPLFERLVQNPDYTCGFITTLSDTAQRIPRQDRQKQHIKNRDFFAQRGKIWLDLYRQEDDRMLPIDTIDCDVLFLQQPWGMRDFPRLLAHRILCAYIPYGSYIVSNDQMAFQLPDFHGYLWKYFAQTHENKQEICASTANGSPVSRAVVATGYPKLDRYLSVAPDRADIRAWPRPNDTHRKRVIFAPHHSIGDKSLRLSTFMWSADVLKHLVKTHPEIDFVLKPHPNLEFELMRNKILSKNQYDAWISEWENGQNTAVFDSGDYYGLFRTSDIMITDSVSFLVEYLPTNQPIIRMVNQNGTQLSQPFEALSDAFYTAKTKDDLYKLFNTLVIQQSDPLEKQRRSKIKQIVPFEVPSSQLVEQILSNIKNPTD